MTAAAKVLLASDPLTDAEVVRRVRAGERSLFEVLMRRYNQRLYRVIRSILRNEAETEDAMQQAWLQAWRQLGQLDAGEAVPGWLTRVAANEALYRLRRARPVSPLPEKDPPTGAPSPEQQAATKELLGLVEAAVDSLPPTQRSAFMLRSVEGLDNQAAAQALGVSPLTLKVRLHRAHRSLREKVGPALELAPLAFRFEASRCNPMVARVMARIAQEP